MKIEYISPSIIRAGVVTRLPQLHSLLYFYRAYLFLSHSWYFMGLLPRASRASNDRDDRQRECSPE